MVRGCNSFYSRLYKTIIRRLFFQQPRRMHRADTYQFPRNRNFMYRTDNNRNCSFENVRCRFVLALRQNEYIGAYNKPFAAHMALIRYIKNSLDADSLQAVIFICCT